MSDNVTDPVERVWVMDSTYAEYMREPVPRTGQRLPTVHVRVFHTAVAANAAASVLYNEDERALVSVTSHIVEGPLPPHEIDQAKLDAAERVRLHLGLKGLLGAVPPDDPPRKIAEDGGAY